MVAESLELDCQLAKSVYQMRRRRLNAGAEC